MIEASHFDFNTAYASVDRHQLQDFEPYIYRTRDMGKTWQLITEGLPAGGLRPRDQGRPGAAGPALRRHGARRLRVVRRRRPLAVAAAQPAGHLGAGLRDLRRRSDRRARMAAASGSSTTSRRSVRPTIVAPQRRRVPVQAGGRVLVNQPATTARRCRRTSPRRRTRPTGSSIDYYLGRRRQRTGDAGDPRRQRQVVRTFSSAPSTERRRGGAAAAEAESRTRRHSGGRRPSRSPRRLGCTAWPGSAGAASGAPTKARPQAPTPPGSRSAGRARPRLSRSNPIREAEGGRGGMGRDGEGWGGLGRAAPPYPPRPSPSIIETATPCRRSGGLTLSRQGAP